MTSIFEGHPLKTRPKLQAKQGSSFRPDILAPQPPVVGNDMVNEGPTVQRSPVEINIIWSQNEVNLGRPPYQIKSNRESDTNWNSGGIYIQSYSES